MPDFICDLCGKALASADSLKNHKQIHIADQPFQCEVCNRIFSRSGHLTRHMRIHTGEKPFQCQECSEAFRTKGVLTRHMRVHTVGRPQVSFDERRVNFDKGAYKCLPCDLAFSLLSALDSHNQCVHNRNELFLCKICGCRFSQQFYLSMHCQTKHPSGSTTQSATVQTHMEPEGMVTVTTQTRVSSNYTTTISTVTSPVGSAYVVTKCSSTATTTTVTQGSGRVTTNTDQNFPGSGPGRIFLGGSDSGLLKIEANDDS